MNKQKQEEFQKAFMEQMMQGLSSGLKAPTEEATDEKVFDLDKEDNLRLQVYWLKEQNEKLQAEKEELRQQLTKILLGREKEGLDAYFTRKYNVDPTKQKTVIENGKITIKQKEEIVDANYAGSGTDK